MSPELETLDQLCGGDLPLTVIRSLFPSDERFIAGISAMLQTGEVRLHLNGIDVPHWQWAHILSSPEPRYRLGITKAGTRRIGYKMTVVPVKIIRFVKDDQPG